MADEMPILQTQQQAQSAIGGIDFGWNESSSATKSVAMKRTARGMRPRKVMETILGLGSVLGRFSPRQLTPVLTVAQAENGCWHLADMGELKRVQKGLPGRYGGRPAIYEILQ